MIEVVVRFKAETEKEMYEEISTFLETLRKYCAAEIGDETDEINEALRELCVTAKVGDWREIPLRYVKMSIYSHHLVERAGIRTLGKLTDQSSQELRQIQNLGEKRLQDIEGALAKLGLRLRESTCAF